MRLPNWTRRPRKAVLAAFRRGWCGVKSWPRRLEGGLATAVRGVDRWLNQSVRGVFGFVETRLGPITVVVIVVVVALSIVFWDRLSNGESGSTTIRNLGLVIAALVALPLAVWRSRVAQLQAETAQRELSNRLYQQGAEMLASEDLSVRLDGIYTLERLAKDEPEQYHVQVMSRLCAFARHPTKDEGTEVKSDTKDERRLREDVQTVMTAICTCHARQLDLEQGAQFLLDLHGANLAGVVLQEENLSNARLGDADLSGARLSGTNLSETWLLDANLSDALLGGANLSETWLLDANLSNASLNDANLSGAWLGSANLSGARFQGANLSGASLTGADLSGADFSAESYLDVDFSDLPGVRSVDKDEMLATGLTQAQLDEARADPNNPPKLNGVLDAETGKQLEWRGRPLYTT